MSVGKIGKLYWEIGADSSKFEKSYSKTSKQTDSLATQFKKAEVAAKVFGDKTGGLAQKQTILKNKIQSLIDKGVSPANKGFKKLTNIYNKNQQQLGKLEKKTSKFGTALKAIGVIGAGIVLSKIKDFFQSTIAPASRAQETAQKFGNVFPGITAKALETAKALKDVSNVTLTESKEMLAFSGNVLTGMGIGQEAALGYSETIGQMAADLKSFNDDSRSTLEITQILTKAMLGERDALVGLGFKISEKDLQDFAAAQGKVYKNLGQQEKAQLSLDLMIQRTKNSYGDVMKSQDTYAYSVRRLENAQKDLKTEIGKQMLPALTDLNNAFVDSSNDGGFFYNALSEIGKAIGKVVQGLVVLVRTFDYVERVLGDNRARVKLVRKEFDKTGASWARFNFILLKHKGVAKTAFEEIKKGAESGDEGLKKMVIAIKNAKKNSGDLKDTAGKALDSLNVAVGKFTGSIKEGPKAGVKGFQNVSMASKQAAADIKNVGKETKKTKKEAKSFLELPWKQKVSTIGGAFSDIASGVQNLISAMQQAATASADRKAGILENERQLALEAAGVAEESAVEQAERELEEARKKGKKKEILEKENALKKAKIDEEYDKKKAEIEYDAELRNWELQKAGAKISLAQAIMNAVKSGFGAPFPLSLVMPGIQSGLATGAFSIQQQALADAKPQKPKFAEGGIVPGNVTTGDRVPVLANSDEMFLNKRQQKNLLDLANGGGKPIMIHNIIELDGTVVADFVTEASRENRIKISDKSVVRY